MATSVITGTITSTGGTPISGVTVLCTLKPYGFRITEGTQIAARQTTTTNGSGVYTFTLEETANITPQGSYYEIEEQVSVAQGGRKVWVISVGASNATVAASLLASAPDQGTPDYLTQDQGDARYVQDGDFVASQIPYDGSAGLIADDVEAALDELDTEKVALAGGTMSGDLNLADNQLNRPKLIDVSETVDAVGNSGTSKTLNYELGNVKTVTLTGNCTFTISNPPATGIAGSLTLILTQDGTGSRLVTWPTTTKWAGGAAPTLTTTAAGIDIITLITVNAGTTWYGFVGGKAFA